MDIRLIETIIQKYPILFSCIYLCVKGIVLEVILALELQCVHLLHLNPVSSPLKLFNFIEHLPTTPLTAWVVLTAVMIPLSSDGDPRLSLPGHALPGHFLLVGVVVDHLWKPHQVDIFGRQRIQRLLLLQVVEDNSFVFPPLKRYSEL